MLDSSAMIEVRLYANLATAAGGAHRAAGGTSAVLPVEARPGLTVRDIIDELGLGGHEIFVIMLNGANAGLDAPLADGDRVGLFPPISGG